MEHQRTYRRAGAHSRHRHRTAAEKGALNTSHDPRVCVVTQMWRHRQRMVAAVCFSTKPRRAPTGINRRDRDGIDAVAKVHKLVQTRRRCRRPLAVARSMTEVA